MQGQGNHESREASVIWLPFAEKPIGECISSIRCEGNCIHTACSQTQLQNLYEPKVIHYDCKEEFPTKN